MIYNKDIIRFTIPLLLKCNLNCSYCHVPNERNEYLKYDIFEKSLYFFFGTEGKQKDLILYGGEPLLLGEERFGKYLNILEKIKLKYKHKDINVTLVTNLTILNDELLILLEKVDSIAVSIDGKEKSHNLNRGLFINTFNNLRKLKLNKELKNKLSINKVVNKSNVYMFFEDIKYLLREFNLDIYYNGALTVSDWDSESVKELSTQLEKIYNYGTENNILYKLGNFFKIPLNGCPFGTLSLSLDGKIYNCEFMANDYINEQGYVIDLKKDSLNLDILNCRYNLISKRCLLELCMGCGKFCTKFSFQSGQFVNKKEENFLKKVKQMRFNHLNNFEEIIKDTLGGTISINFKYIEYKSIFKIYNFLYSLNYMLSINIFNISFIGNNSIIIKLLFMRLLKKADFNYIINIIDYNMESYDLRVNLKDSYAYDNKGIFIGNINSEINFFK